MISEDLIRQAAQEYEQALGEQLSEPEPHRFSPRFVRKIKNRFTQAEHGTAYLVVRRVACILLILALFGSAILAVPSVRASFISWFVHRDFTGGTWYQPNGDGGVTDVGEYAIGWVPENFALDDRYERERAIRYLNEDRDMILLEWKSRASNGMSVGAWSDEVYRTTVNGRPADVYAKTEIWTECSIVWTNEDESIIFCLTTNCDAETAIKIAESVCAVKP